MRLIKVTGGWVGKSNVYLCFLFADEKILSKGAHRPFGHDAL